MLLSSGLSDRSFCVLVKLVSPLVAEGPATENLKCKQAIKLVLQRP